MARLTNPWRLLLVAINGVVAGGNCDAAQRSLLPPDVFDAIAIEQEIHTLDRADPASAAKARYVLAAEPALSRRSANEPSTGRVVNGLPTIRYPEAGALLRGADPKSAQAWCSGTLVGSRTFLSAAHCIARDPRASAYKVFLQNAGFFDVVGIAWQADMYKFPEADLVLLTLDRPVPGIKPVAINRDMNPPLDRKGTIVGFGRTGGLNRDFGIKRVGSVKLGSCDATLPKDLICWNYDAAVRMGGEDSNTCNGDSGGGLIYEPLSGGIVLAGATSGGARSDCQAGDRSYDANIFHYRDWIVATAGTDLGTFDDSTSIGTGDVWGDIATLDEANPEVHYRFNVPDGAKLFSVAMNGQDSGKAEADFDLYVMPGDTTDVSEAVCAEQGPGQFAFCSVAGPGASQWTVLVKRKKGRGLVQTTVTVGR